MARVIVSNDWKRIEFSKQFKDELWTRKDLDDNHGAWRTSDEVIDALMKLRGKSFEEIHDGVRILEYDEDVCHPVIDEEEYGGENIHFEPGKGDIEWGYVCSYNPMTGECDEDSAYDAESDSFNTSESDIEGSHQLAEKIISRTSGKKREALERLVHYSSCRLYDIEMASILPDDEIETYLYIFACCLRDFIDKDNIHIWSIMYSKEQIKDMNRKFRFAQEEIEKKIKPMVQLLKQLNLN